MFCAYKKLEKVSIINSNNFLYLNKSFMKMKLIDKILFIRNSNIDHNSHKLFAFYLMIRKFVSDVDLLLDYQK